MLSITTKICTSIGLSWGGDSTVGLSWGGDSSVGLSWGGDSSVDPVFQMKNIHPPPTHLSR